MPIYLSLYLPLTFVFMYLYILHLPFLLVGFNCFKVVQNACDVVNKQRIFCSHQ